MYYALALMSLTSCLAIIGYLWHWFPERRKFVLWFKVAASLFTLFWMFLSIATKSVFIATILICMIMLLTLIMKIE